MSRTNDIRQEDNAELRETTEQRGDFVNHTIRAICESLSAGSRYTDNQPRMTLRFEGADSPWNELVLPHWDGVQLGDEFEVEVRRVDGEVVA